MTHAGAAGETADQMAEVLRFALPEERTHEAFENFLTVLDGADKPYEFSVANALWGQEGCGLLPEFLELARVRYGAGLREVDFQADGEGARRAINPWVAKSTLELPRRPASVSSICSLPVRSAR